MRCHALIAVLALCLGCATPPYFIAPAAPRAQSLLVLPLNFEVLPPSNLVDGVEELQDLVRQHLAATGHQVETLPMRATMKHWASAVRTVGGVADARAETDPERYLAARAELVRRAAAASPAEAVVLATVEIRLAPITDGRKVEWDGVVRRLKVKIGETWTDRKYSHTGTARVTTLHVAVFDRQGMLLFERSRGLEIIQEIRIEHDRFWVDDRKDLFQDDALLRDAVQGAFEPWIEPAA